MLIAIATFANSIDANIAKGLLESEGIQCKTSDDAFHQLWPTNEVQILVAEIDKEKAITMLKKHNLMT